MIGALATGNSDSSVVEFYSASDSYTTAGTYDFEVIVSGGAISSAKIKLSSESTYRDLTLVDGTTNILGGSLATDPDTGDPLNPEHSLQLKVDLSTDNTFTGTLRVKKGFAGILVEMINSITETGGRLDIGEGTNQDYQDRMTLRIEDEESRLDDMELRLIQKYARLEKVLAELQQQMQSVSAFSSALGV